MAYPADIQPESPYRYIWAMRINPKLSQFDLTMIIVSLVIGVGIFKTPATVAQQAGNETIFYLAWIIGGFVSICGALTFAEIGSRLPAAGGYYKIFSTAYHPAFAFMLNWSQVIINAGSSAGVAMIGAEYISQVFPAVNPKIIAVGIILILFSINYAGIKMGARTQNVLSVLKIILILCFCCGIFFNPQEQPVTIIHSFPEYHFLTALGFCFISIFFTYGGYQQTVNFGADVIDAQRNIPRAILKGMSIVIVLYLLLNITYIHVLGFQGVQNSTLPASALAGAIFGNTGSTIASVVLFISVMGFLNTSIMSNPRVYFAMAEDKTLPSVFKKVNPKTQTQEFGLRFFVIVMIASIFVLGSFEKIVNYVIFIDSFSLATAAIAIFILRKKSAENFNGFRLKGIYKIAVPVIFIITLLFVTVNTVRSDYFSAGIGGLILAGGLPLYYLLKYLINKNSGTEQSI